MRVLYVTGSDTSATDISEIFGLEKAFALTVQQGGQSIIETEEVYAECRILEFGEVDIEFILFIQNQFIDYDESKGRDFFCFSDQGELLKY